MIFTQSERFYNNFCIMNNYISLHNHDTFSLLDGVRRPKDFLLRAKEFGMKSFAQTNHGTMAGNFEFYDAAKEVGIKPILGIEAYFTDDKTVKNKENNHIILLAKNLKGYKALLKAQYLSNIQGFYYRPRIDWTDLEYMKGNVIVSSACINGIIAKYIKNNNINQAEKNAIRLKEMFGTDFYFEYIALNRTDVYGLIWVKMRELAKKLRIKSIITVDTHYLNKDENILQDITHLIRDKLTMEDVKQGKGWIFDDKDLYLKDYNEVENIMCKIFNKNIVEKYLKNTFEIDEKIEEFDIYPASYVFPNTGFKEEYLKTMLKEKFKQKVPKGKEEKYRQRLNYEYKIIKNMGFLEYFWIVQDIVNWAKSQGIQVGYGRGSVGGCLIAFLLGISDTDPIRFNLYFERFLNPTRKKMPDIDIDFQKTRRQEVFEYIKKYGVENIAQIATYFNMSIKVAFKDVCRVFGVPYKQVNEITKGMDDKYLEDIKIPQKLRKYWDIACRMSGNIRQLGKHAAGVIIADKPVYNYIPVNNLKGQIISGIDGDTLQAKKFLKIDILGLDALDMIQACVKYIKKYENIDIDINNIPIDDKETFKLFQDVDTDNILQFKTPAFKELLKEAYVENFEHLVELNTLNRPNSKSAGYHIEYINRRFGSNFKIPKLLQNHLKDTYGLLIYQEQIANIFSDWLDISFGEADNLRREMEVIGIKKIIERYKEKLLTKYNEEDIMEAIKEIEKVAGYAFNKAHAVSYSMIGYQMAYLKAHYRKYFNLAVLNFECDEEAIQKTIDDCYKNNIPLKDFNINEISFDFVLNNKGEIIPGCKILKGIGEKSVIPLIRNKPYYNIEDFLRRSKVRNNVLQVLYDFDFFKTAFGNIENKKVEKFLLNKKVKVEVK